MKTTAALLILVSITAPVRAQQVQGGRLHVIWDVEGAAGMSEHFLVDAAGRGRLLLPDAGLAAEGLTALDRKLVETRTTAVSGGAIPTFRMIDVKTAPGAELVAGGDMTRARYDFVTVLCRFADDAIPSLMRSDVERVHGGTYPGVRNYFAELSWNADIMKNSKVTDWYALPKPRSAYVSSEQTDFGALARDCTAAAEADVYFPDYFGINLQFSSGLSVRAGSPHDTLSFGGSWTLNLSGTSRTWGLTWLSRGHALNYVVLTHEMGHALGWPHSSGDYGKDYDSAWDIMSRGYVRWEAPYGWLGVHTIAHHKDASGWVPDRRRWAPGPASSESALLVRTAVPSTDGYLMARIPADGASHYTVEARRIAGQDQPLPSEAVVLHHVTNNRARVVDVDNNGDPNDAGAQWHPDEVFEDSVNGVTISVDSTHPMGFNVTITRGWRLSVAVSGAGKVSGEVAGMGSTVSLSCALVCTTVVAQRGLSANVEAQPEPGWEFVEWIGACTGTGSCATSLTRNREVRAVFSRVGALANGEPAPGVMGAPYADTLGVQLGSPADEWRVAAGALPTGIELSETGILSGTPEVHGSFDLKVAVNIDGTAYLIPLTIQVKKPALTVQQVMDQYLGGSGLSDAEKHFIDLLGNRNGRLDIADIKRWLVDGGHVTDGDDRLPSFSRNSPGAGL